MANLESILNQLHQERRRLTSQLESLNSALLALGADNHATPKRRMSAHAIARIRSGQKARWAKWRKEQKKR